MSYVVSMPKVVISGAGIGGLTSALALMKLGFEVQVFEQAPELGEVGAGLQIAPNGSRILMALGLADQLETVVCEADYKEVRLWNTGERRRLFDLGEDCRKRFGAPYWFVHRADLHCMLVEAINALAPDAILTGRTGVSCRETAKGVELHFQDGSSASGDVLIGADGVHSRLRGTMFDSPRAEFTGMMSWRGIARMADLPDDLRGHVGTNWVGPGGHVVTYPLRCGEIMNFAGIVERSDWTVESWSTRGTKEECARDFANWHPSIHHMIGVLDRTFKWALLGREPLKSWSRGRVALLGDAAHPTLPFLAHGAIMALEDAAVLARCLRKRRNGRRSHSSDTKQHASDAPLPSSMDQLKTGSDFTIRCSPTPAQRGPISTSSGTARGCASAMTGYSSMMPIPCPWQIFRPRCCKKGNTRDAGSTAGRPRFPTNQLRFIEVDA